MLKTLKSPLGCKKIKLINPKGNQPWIFIGKTDAKAEAPILWPPDAKSRLIGKDLDPGKDRGREEKGMTEDEMVGWITDSMDMSLSKLREIVKDREAWRATVHEVAKNQTRLGDWRTATAAITKTSPCFMGSSETEMVLRCILPWGKGGGYLYSPRIIQSLNMGCQWYKIIFLDEKIFCLLLMPWQIPTFLQMLKYLPDTGFEWYDSNRALFLTVIHFACISILLYLNAYKEY